MEEINLKKQKISYEGKSVEGTNEFAVKGEYLIPDTHPDVYKILMVEVKPKINNTESFTDKVFVEGEILYTVIYTSKDGVIKVDTTIVDDTIWMSQNELAKLFDTTKNNISSHMKNIFESGELEESSTVKNFLTVQKEGTRNVKRMFS